MSDRLRRAWVAQARGDLAVGKRFTGRDGARDLIDPPLKWRHGVHVKNDRAQVVPAAGEQPANRVDRVLHLGRRRRFGRRRKPPLHAGTRPAFVRLGKLDAGHDVIAPRDAA